MLSFKMGHPQMKKMKCFKLQHNAECTHIKLHSTVLSVIHAVGLITSDWP